MFFFTGKKRILLNGNYIHMRNMNVFIGNLTIFEFNTFIICKILTEVTVRY